MQEAEGGGPEATLKLYDKLKGASFMHAYIVYASTMFGAVEEESKTCLDLHRIVIVNKQAMEQLTKTRRQRRTRRRP